MEVIRIVLFSNFGAGPVEFADAADAVAAAKLGGIATGVGTLGLFVISLKSS